MEKSKVCIRRCDDYDTEKIKSDIIGMIGDLGVDAGLFKGKKILLKPNLLSDSPPEKAVTTHPVFLEAVIQALFELGLKKKDIIIADSPGIVVQYSEQGLKQAYAKTGLLELSEKTGVALNYDTSYKMLPVKDGRVVKSLEIIKPVADADIIINLPKFKTHNLTTITGAIKNIYGVIHGRSKALYHTKFLELDKFYELLFDLNSLIRPAITVMDGIIGLEGEGPGASGTPRKVGLILASRDPVALDLVVTGIMGIEPSDFPLQGMARSRGIASADMDRIEVKGPSIEELIIDNFKVPRAGNLERITSNRFIKTYILPFMRNSLHPTPRPDHERCNLCESCIKVCPEQCISVKDSRISIDYNKCIRCYCCAEMCPQGAMAVKESAITRFLSRLVGKK